MNALLAPSTIASVTGSLQTMTMTTREIAELTGKEHKTVLYDTRCMFLQLGRTSADFSAHVEVPGPNGAVRRSPIFRLPKDLTLTLVSGYSVSLRHKIVTRWMELEEVARSPAAAPVAQPQVTSPEVLQALLAAVTALNDTVRLVMGAAAPALPSPAPQAALPVSAPALPTPPQAGRLRRFSPYMHQRTALYQLGKNAHVLLPAPAGVEPEQWRSVVKRMAKQVLGTGNYACRTVQLAPTAVLSVTRFA